MRNLCFLLIIGLMISCNVNQNNAAKETNSDSAKLTKELVDKALTQVNPKKVIPDITSNSKFVKYSNSKHSFSIFYPKEWSAIEDYNPMIVFLSSDNTDQETNFNIIVIPDETRSLDEVYKANKKEMQMYINGVKFIGSDEGGTIGNLNFKKLVSRFSNPQSGIEQMTLTYSFVKNNKSFIITFSSNPLKFEEKTLLYESIINTFKIF